MSDIVRKGQTSLKHLTFRAVSATWLLCGLLVSYAIASLAEWRMLFYFLEQRFWLLLSTTFISFIVMSLIIRYIRRFALVNLWAIVVFIVVLTGGVQVIVATTIQRQFFPFFYIVFYFGTLIVMLVWVRIIKKVQHLRLAIIPFGMTAEVVEAHHAQLELFQLEEPEIDRLSKNLDGIVVDVREALSGQWLRFLANCRLRGIRVYQAEELFEAITGRISLSHLSQGMVDAFSTSMVYQPIKRALDIICVIITLPITLVVMALTALAIRIESPGKILFVQARIGQGGREFKILKFRSMSVGSERAGSQFTSENDERITHVGAFIRHYRLDEIPQIWNILKGEMSLIGPRPEQPAFVEHFNENITYYDYRHTVKPGITGWAQVSLGYTSDEKTTRDKLEYDLYYIKHQSFWLDLLIVLKTLKTVLTGFGAR